jgi:GT2 family glycosyltransferase
MNFLSRQTRLRLVTDDFQFTQADDPQRSVRLPRNISSGTSERPRVRGKFIFIGEKKFWIRGVTYGTFRPAPAGEDYPDVEMVERDFRAIADEGLNSIRLYTTPPRWLLDIAASHGLMVMIGIPWQQHVAFLDSREGARSILRTVRDSVRMCADHPAVLCFAVGNEIPASVVRWYGRRRIERFIEKVCLLVKEEDPLALVTYVNFPTTEYLDLHFLDFVAFNVYLESQHLLSAYLGRLQNLAGERPLLMAELGLDSRRNGEHVQAKSLDWQIATAFESGCVGAFVFAWTDEWFRGGHEIADWDFGLTTRDRRPKQARGVVGTRFAQVPFPAARQWPRISVVVCSYNGSRTIGETLSALNLLEYPNFEVVVVDDGSTDSTGAIAGKFKARLIQTENQGLSAARNCGMQAAEGEIIAYIDDDAYPDPHWLTYLADTFSRTEHAGVGGPNIAPPDDGLIAECVANAPGGPVHVLSTDEIAEHIPGCNMAYRRDRLMELGGFDTRFRVAGDDVDLCWRLQERGWTLGFSPAAMVWHHRRNTIRAYLKQQMGYAEAESILAEKWPSKYNSAGHVAWQGRLYGKGVVQSLFPRSRIYHGVWGSAPFQSIYQPSAGLISSLPLMPEWYVLLLSLALFAALGVAWGPLLWLLLPFIAGSTLTIFQAVRAGYKAPIDRRGRSHFQRIGLKVVVAFFHLAQPAARLLGRIQHRLGPWCWKGFVPLIPTPKMQSLWSEQWEAPEGRLAQIEGILRNSGKTVTRGGDYDCWDLTVRGGLFGSVRTLAMVEEHGGGKQLFRLRAFAKVPGLVLGVLLLLLVLAGFAAADHAWLASSAVALVASAVALLAYMDCAIAMKHWSGGVDDYLKRDCHLTMLTDYEGE